MPEQAYAKTEAPVQNMPISNAASVDDRRPVPVAQLVLQRVKSAPRPRPSDGAFIYYPDLSAYDDRIPYNGEKIGFTPYFDTPVTCERINEGSMLAFKFMERQNENYIEYFKLLANPENFDLSPGKKYVAFVPDKAHSALYDAKNRNIISIETFLHHSKKDKEGYDSKTSFLSGDMKHTENGWMANIYGLSEMLHGPLKNFMRRFTPKKKLIRSLSAEALKKESIAAKAFLYASIYGGKQPVGMPNYMKQLFNKQAHNNLISIANSKGGLEALSIAKNMIAGGQDSSEIKKILDSFLLTNALFG